METNQKEIREFDLQNEIDELEEKQAKHSLDIDCEWNHYYTLKQLREKTLDIIVGNEAKINSAEFSQSEYILNRIDLAIQEVSCNVKYSSQEIAELDTKIGVVKGKMIALRLCGLNKDK